MRYHGAMNASRKPPPPPSVSHEDDDEALAQALADLARDVAEKGGHERQDQLGKQIRNALRKQNDDILYGAIECARDQHAGAWQLLREQVEEAAATVFVRRDNTPAEEIDAFLVPVFVH